MLDSPLRSLAELQSGNTSWVAFRAGQRLTEPSAPQAVFPGSFNPLHAGHRQLAHIAAARLATSVAFELALLNVDKDPLNPHEVMTRLTQFCPESVVLVTRSPTFVEKARLFPAATFIVGIDTLVRLVDPGYYPSAKRRDEALEEIVAQGCRFLVFGRLHRGQFLTLADLSLPPGLARICTGIAESEFRADLASRDLR
jgi:hypothetical protein